MVKPALVEHRPWLFASLIAAIAYYFLWNNPIGGLWLILLKGGGAGLLAIYAWRRTDSFDGLILAGVFVVAAVADMAIELSLELGGSLFAVSHLLATGFYVRNRRPETALSQKGLAIILLTVTPLVSYGLSLRVDIAAYAGVLGLMAAAAWMSRFPRFRVGIGALLFVISDWLIFSRFGPVDMGTIPDILVWPIYYAGQFMIATGVVQTLRFEAGRGEKPAA